MLCVPGNGAIHGTHMHAKMQTGKHAYIQQAMEKSEQLQVTIHIAIVLPEWDGSICLYLLIWIWCWWISNNVPCLTKRTSFLLSFLIAFTSDVYIVFVLGRITKSKTIRAGFQPKMRATTRIFGSNTGFSRCAGEKSAPQRNHWIRSSWAQKQFVLTENDSRIRAWDTT